MMAAIGRLAETSMAGAVKQKHLTAIAVKG
jgi:hypothetical protein